MQKTFDKVADIAVEAVGLDAVAHTLMRLWEAGEDQSCYRGPNGKAFPWEQVYGTCRLTPFFDLEAWA